MKEAIYLRTGVKVTALPNPELGDGWYLITFVNGVSINVYKSNILLLL